LTLSKECGEPIRKSQIIQKTHKLKSGYSIQEAWKRARSLARIKVSAFGAGDRGFKSHRARLNFLMKTSSFPCFFNCAKASGNDYGYSEKTQKLYFFVTKKEREILFLFLVYGFLLRTSNVTAIPTIITIMIAIPMYSTVD
jgi:hypothetical protein